MPQSQRLVSSSFNQTRPIGARGNCNPVCLRGLILTNETYRPQVQVTAATREAGPRTPTTTPTSGIGSGGAGGGSASQPHHHHPSGDSSTWDFDYDYNYNYMQELIRVAPPALARLLSFEHLR